jgi:dipeptidyl aminopeptidase/acylaminoacyl peptidase
MTAVRLCVVALVVLFVLPALAGAAEWTLDDILLEERAGNWTPSPDGRHAAWTLSTVATVDDAERRVSHLWISRLDATGDAAEPRQLTRTGSVSQPRFSPSGEYLAFLSDRDAPAGTPKIDDKTKPQVWLLPLGGGEAYPITRLDRGVRSFGWTGDESLVVVAQESPTARETLVAETRKDTSRVIDDEENEPPVRLFSVDLDGDSERLTANMDWIDSLAVSPDGKYAVVNAEQSLRYEFDQKTPGKTRLVDLSSGEETVLFVGEKRVRPFAVQWAPDSSGFYFLDSFTNHPIYDTATINHLFWFAIGAERPEKIDLDWDWGAAYGYAPLPDGVMVLLAEGVRYRPARYVRQGDSWRKAEMEGEHSRNLDSWLATADGTRVVYRTSSGTRPPQWFVADLDGHRMSNERQLTTLNPGYESKPKGKIEIVRWTGALDEEVNGVLHYPLDWVEGEARPLILDIHGGPTGADRDTWSQSWASPNILWQQRGAFVFQVNYHGSGNHGLDWAESIAGHYYEYEIPDIESGVDLLIERGLVDPDMLGSTGWSNGGILTADLITRTQRYKAASIGAADVEWISDWANVDFGAAFDNYYFGTTPWEDPQAYIDKSPFFRLTEVTTPSIIHTGTEDTNVPPHQSWSLFRAMQYIGKAPVKLITYPGEPHGLRKIVHQRRKTQEDLAFFDRYLFGTLEEEDPAIKDGSPLAALLARARAERQGGLWGATNNGVLVPETVEFSDLNVGRFEVTRAQWAAFDGEFEVEPGNGNLPITGVSFDRAKEYASWLAETTGEAFRLPTAEEAKKLAEAGGKGGNTLDRWAGYSPNPEDAARLARVIGELAGQAPLLREVGSLAGKGDNPVFDLDGNAAEWSVREDGTGKAVGASAERSPKARSKAMAATEYTGLRVVVGDS